jgi:DNA helicase HerA-like ATPase
MKPVIAEATTKIITTTATAIIAELVPFPATVVVVVTTVTVEPPYVGVPEETTTGVVAGVVTTVGFPGVPPWVTVFTGLVMTVGIVVG